MHVLKSSAAKQVTLQLSKDLVRTIKRGHCWVYSDALRSTPNAPPGTRAILLDNHGGREIGRGYYDPNNKIALRLCTTRQGEELSEAWAEEQLLRAIRLRKSLFGDETTGFRLFNGEGDRLPGLVCDLYSDTAVLSLDGEAARNFWDVMGISRFLVETLDLSRVYERTSTELDTNARLLYGMHTEQPLDFTENGIKFTASPVKGQKTGFYLDQRENRRLIQNYVTGKTVINLFGYTGGFSVYAGKAGASQVTTVDTAQPALAIAEKHWIMNGLDPDHHKVLCQDAFNFLEGAKKDKAEWDIVILDPPSFAPSERTVGRALGAYARLIGGAADITREDGILAASSCSSHITMEQFLKACMDGISKAKKRATILGIYRQPPDHPAPLAMPELLYLKFVVMLVHV